MITFADNTEYNFTQRFPNVEIVQLLKGVNELPILFKGNPTYFICHEGLLNFDYQMQENIEYYFIDMNAYPL